METSVVRVLKFGDEVALEAFLLPRVESSMFLIGNMRAAGLVDNGQTYQGTYAARLEDGKIVGVVAHYWNQNLVLQAPVDLMALCAEAVKGSGRPIRGLVGPSNQVEVAKRALGIDGSNAQMVISGGPTSAGGDSAFGAGSIGASFQEAVDERGLQCKPGAAPQLNHWAAIFNK